MLTGNELQSWYIVFDDADHRGWWNIFTRPGFEHVWCFRSEKGAIVSVNHIAWRTHIEGVPSNAEAVAIDLVCAGKTVLSYSFAPTKSVFIRGLLYCVPLTAAVIGFRTFAITPYQLYRSLIRRGATIIGGD